MRVFVVKSIIFFHSEFTFSAPVFRQVLRENLFSVLQQLVKKSKEFHLPISIDLEPAAFAFSEYKSSDDLTEVLLQPHTRALFSLSYVDCNCRLLTLTG